MQECEHKRKVLWFILNGFLFHLLGSTPITQFPKVARALNAMIHHVRHVCRPSGISCYLFGQNLTESTSEVLYSIFTSGPADLADSFPRAQKIEG